jgi:hypothetical protein
VAFMPTLDSIDSLVHSERTLNAGRIHVEGRVLPDDFPTSREADDSASRAKHDHPSCSCSTSESGRNLVVCIDGTANQFSEKVSKLYFPACRRVLMLSRTRTSSSSTAGSSKTRRSLRTITAVLGPTSENPRLLFTIGSKHSITLWIWPLHGMHNVQFHVSIDLTVTLQEF